MPFNRSRFASLVLIFAAATLPVFAQSDVKAIVLKHLKTSRDFSLKVARPNAGIDVRFQAHASANELRRADGAFVPEPVGVSLAIFGSRNRKRPRLRR